MQASMKAKELIRRALRSSSLALGCLLLTAAAANADCGATVGRLARFTSVPVILHFGNSTPLPLGINPIVGVWHVNYVSGGAPFLESFDTWHADGTEFEIANPIDGNVCVGAWKQVGTRTVRLRHIGWNFDTAGNSIGTFTLAETNTVSSDGNSYSGNFDYKVYDTDGKVTYEATGTQSAPRISAN